MNPAPIPAQLPAPILQVITAREAAAGLAADQLREQIHALSQRLSAIETELADLATTRTTLLRLAGHPDEAHPDHGQSAKHATHRKDTGQLRDRLDSHCRRMMSASGPR